MPWSVLLTATGVVLAAAGLLGAAWAVLKARRVREDFELLVEHNDELRKALGFEREERQREQRECRDEIARLRGSVDTLTSQVVTGLVSSIHDGLASAIREAIHGQ